MATLGRRLVEMPPAAGVVQVVEQAAQRTEVAIAVRRIAGLAGHDAVAARRRATRLAERRDVATIGTEGVDEGRGDDDAVGAGLRDRADVGRLRDPEPDRDRAPARPPSPRGRAVDTSGGSDVRAPVTPTSDTQ